MEKAFKYRMYPNREQKNIISQDFLVVLVLYITITWQNVGMPMKKMESHSTIRHVLRI